MRSVSSGRQWTLVDPLLYLKTNSSRLELSVPFFPSRSLFLGLLAETFKAPLRSMTGSLYLLWYFRDRTARDNAYWITSSLWSECKYAPLSVRYHPRHVGHANAGTGITFAGLPTPTAQEDVTKNRAVEFGYKARTFAFCLLWSSLLTRIDNVRFPATHDARQRLRET